MGHTWLLLSFVEVDRCQWIRRIDLDHLSVVLSTRHCDVDVIRLIPHHSIVSDPPTYLHLDSSTIIPCALLHYHQNRSDSHQCLVIRCIKHNGTDVSFQGFGPVKGAAMVEQGENRLSSSKYLNNYK